MGCYSALQVECRVEGTASYCLHCAAAAAGNHTVLLLVTWLESGFYCFCSCVKLNMKLL